MSDAEAIPPSLDERGRRRLPRPRSVRGRYHAWRARAQGVLVFFFLALPWLRIGGEPALKLDVYQGRFAILGQTFLASDAPLLVFLLLGWGLLFLVATSLFGRVWCGWACPQTVFIEAVFRRIERWIEGEPPLRARPSLPARALKWALFALVSLVITHSFLALFVGGRELLMMIQAPPRESWPSFVFIGVSNAVILFNFGWFREQFCMIACPYGKLQSVLMDRHSLVVAYDARRGEPRRGVAPAPAAATKTGDCVDCRRCVQVCPTAIDIRQGTQLECVACTACIDACDDVMTRLKKPRGLIRYASEAELAGERRRWARPRPLAYLVLLLAFSVGLSWALARRSPLEVTVLKAAGAPYELLDGAAPARTVANRFTLELRNPAAAPVLARLEISPASAARSAELWLPQNPVETPARGELRVPLVVRLREGELSEGRARVTVRMTIGDYVREEVLSVVGPL